jgi:hypothetical protein
MTRVTHTVKNHATRQAVMERDKPSASSILVSLNLDAPSDNRTAISRARFSERFNIRLATLAHTTSNANIPINFTPIIMRRACGEEFGPNAVAEYG